MLLANPITTLMFTYGNGFMAKVGQLVHCKVICYRESNKEVSLRLVNKKQGDMMNEATHNR